MTGRSSQYLPVLSGRKVTKQLLMPDRNRIRKKPRLPAWFSFCRYPSPHLQGKVEEEEEGIYVYDLKRKRGMQQPFFRLEEKHRGICRWVR